MTFAAQHPVAFALCGWKQHSGTRALVSQNAVIEGASFRLLLVFIAFLFDGTAQRGGRDARRRHRPEGLIKAGSACLHNIKASTRQELATLKGHSESVNSVAFSPDGNTLASAGRDYVRLWIAATKEAVDAVMRRE